MWQLILFRGIQGLGAGALFPISLAVIGDLFTPAERGKYQGLFGAVFGISFIIGPALGGFLTDNFSWHWIFYVNMPIGLVACTSSGGSCPTSSGDGASRDLDYLGARRLHRRPSLPARRPDEQAETPTGPTPPSAASSSIGLDPRSRLRLRRVARQGADRAARPVARNRTYSASIICDLLRELRLLRRRSSSCRAGSRSSGATARPSRATRSCRSWSG